MITILTGNVLDTLPTLPSNSVQCCVTSPPYWGLRDYGTGTWEGGDAGCDHKPTEPRKRPELTGGGCASWSTRDVTVRASGECPKCGARRIDQQLGSEATPQEYVANMVAVFREVRRILREDGVLFLNLGDSYVNKQLGMIPARVALALQDDGWILRSEITWCKKAPMPESVTDRPTSATEKIFLLTKSARYFYDAQAVAEQATATDIGATGIPFGGVKYPNGDMAATYSGNEYVSTGTRNQRNFWLLGPEPYAEAHFATFPTEIPRRAILAGTSAHGACPTCGAPWERVVERGEMVQCGHVKSHHNHKRADEPDSTLSQLSALRTGLTAETKTIGFAPTCACGCTDTVPCVVLDPFCGSGTTGAVARTLGRDFIGCELNPAYVKLAEKRIGHAQPALFGL